MGLFDGNTGVEYGFKPGESAEDYQKRKAAADAANRASGDWWGGENSLLGKWGRDLSGETAQRAQRDAENAAKQAADDERAWKEAQAAKALAELGITAEEYQAAQMGPTAYDQITEDPRWKENQVAALNQLAGWSTGGLTETDSAALDMANRKVAQQEIAARGAAEANQRARGFAPSGAGAVLGAQAARAAAANRMADQGTQTLGMLQNRQMTSTGQMGSMAGQVRGQEYGMSSDKARARDAVNQFNTSAINNAAAFNANQRSNLKNARAGRTGVSYTPTNVQYTPAQQQALNSQQNAWSGLGGAVDLAGKGVTMIPGMNWMAPLTFGASSASMFGGGNSGGGQMPTSSNYASKPLFDNYKPLR